jgi:uncharacterized lipoprotein
MRMITRTAVLMLALPIAGCAYFNPDSHSHAQDSNYLTARSIPPLRIPPGVSSNAFHNEYPVSDGSFSLTNAKISNVPPGL